MKKGIRARQDLIVVGDLHIAKSWDDIEQLVENQIRYLNPNQKFRDVVNVTNKASNILGLIINGDAIDYIYTDYYQKNKRSNWELFYQILQDLTVPFFHIPGNHDYRPMPYNYGLYGLKHVNISDDIRRKLAQKIGHNKFRFLDELKSITVNSKFDFLQDYLGVRCPYHKQIGHYQCIFLDTGCDAFVRSKIWPIYLKKILLGGRPSIDLEGFQRDDVEFVEKTIKELTHETIHLFMHAPLMNPWRWEVGLEYKLSANHFFKSLIKQGLDDTILIKNGGNLIRTLRKVENNIILISSHIHDSRYILIHKTSLKVTTVTLEKLNLELNNARYIKQITILPLGAIGKKSGQNKKIGYLRITPDYNEEIILEEYQ